MKIRQATSNDVSQIIPLLDGINKIHIEKRPDVFKNKTNEEIKNNLEEMMLDENNIILLAEDNQIIKGILICKVKEIENHINLKNAKVLWINEIGIKQEYRRNGIGSALIQRAKEIAKENNCVRLELNCWEFNENAIKFYKNLGLTTQRRVMEINIVNNGINQSDFTKRT